MCFICTHLYLHQAMNEFAWSKIIFGKFKKRKVDCIYLSYFVFVPKGFYISLYKL